MALDTEISSPITLKMADEEIIDISSSSPVNEGETTITIPKGVAGSNQKKFDNESKIYAVNSVIQYPFVPLFNASAGNLQHEDAFRLVFSKLMIKECKPLMTDEDVKKARALQHYAKQKKAPLTKARDTCLPDTTLYPFYREPYTKKTFCFFTARYNGFDDSVFSQVIPYAEHALEFGKQRAHLRTFGEESSRQALAFILEATKAIIRAVDGLGGHGMFANLAEAQRTEIFGVVFDQYPLWLVKMKFRRQEAVVVDFCQIFAGIDAEREKFQLFFRHMFVDMCEGAYIIHVREAKENAEEIMKVVWSGFPNLSHVQALGLGDQYDFPGISMAPCGRGPHSSTVAPDDFDSDIETPFVVARRGSGSRERIKW